MDYKYSIIDDENNKVLGFCNEVEVLQPNDECCSVLNLYGFKFTEEFMEMPKIILSNFRLNYLSKDEKSLGGYYFSPSINIKLGPLEIPDDKPIEIVGHFSEEPLPFAFEVWERLRENPNERGQWKNCSLEEKQAWLQVVRLRCHTPRTDRNEQVITIDGNLIHDVETFFIAIGEAINGSFGYFGAGLDGLDDCLCGGFGLNPPFTLEWRSFHKSFSDELVNHAKFVSLLLKILTNRRCKIHLTALS